MAARLQPGQRHDPGQQRLDRGDRRPRERRAPPEQQRGQHRRARAASITMAARQRGASASACASRAAIALTLTMPRAVTLGTSDVDRLRHAQQQRADRQPVGRRLEQVEADVGGVEAGHDQQVGDARPAGCPAPRGRGSPRHQRRVGVHLAVHLQLGRRAADQASAWRILRALGLRRRRSSSATAAPPWAPCRSSRTASAASMRHLGDLLGGRVDVHVGVADEQRAGLQDQRRERVDARDARAASG